MGFTQFGDPEMYPTNGNVTLDGGICPLSVQFLFIMSNRRMILSYRGINSGKPSTMDLSFTHVENPKEQTIYTFSHSRTSGKIVMNLPNYNLFPLRIVKPYFWIDQAKQIRSSVVGTVPLEPMSYFLSDYFVHYFSVIDQNKHFTTWLLIFQLKYRLIVPT